MSLKRFVELLHEEVIDITNKVLGRDLEPTHYLAEADNNMKMVLFRVVDSPYLCVGNVLNSRKRLYRHVLGVETDIDAYRKVLSLTPVKPREISFEEKYEVLTEIDLEKVPFIKFYPRDGGRYLSSSIYIACLDNVCNASIHRTMIVSKDSVVARIVPRNLRYIYDNYMRKGIREVPVAIVVGSHPATLLCAAISPPFGVFELELVPQLFKHFTITYTPRYSLPVPSDAALVLEGRITDITVPEGPFVDLLHLYDSVRNEPLIKIDAMYVNYDEYFNVILPAGKEHKLLQSFYREALIWDYVSRVVPKVHKVRLLESSGSWLVAAVAIEKTHDADAKNAVLASFAAHPSLKMVMVLDPDVDIDSESRLLWALATRFRGRDSLILVEKARCSTLDPSSPTGVCDKVGFDLTIPLSEDRSRYSYVEVR
ncbi:MAG: UbiD family decarboxylase [Desulfurococcaceae archaeon]|nr:UbiD family decarboxylase [Desulfurococcaceae archaeon]